ncbi:hypothetical protein IW150_006091, partial [Coemansia sp. RSA 2607]
MSFEKTGDGMYPTAPRAVSERSSSASSSLAPTSSEKRHYRGHDGDSHNDGSEKHDEHIDVLPPTNDADKSVVDEAIAQPKPVGVLQLFRFATNLDRGLTIAGVFFSCASGVVTPVMIIIFSNLMGVILQY